MLISVPCAIIIMNIEILTYIYKYFTCLIYGTTYSILYGMALPLLSRYHLTFIKCFLRCIKVERRTFTQFHKVELLGIGISYSKKFSLESIYDSSDLLTLLG